MRETSRRMAVCGLLCALAVVLMLLGGVIPLAVYACPILVMAVLLPVQEQYGAGPGRPWPPGLSFPCCPHCWSRRRSKPASMCF